MEFKAPRGTSDHLPELKSNWNKIEIIARETARSFGYNEITTPVFEQTSLFKRAVGEGTDVVTKEMYNLTDVGGSEFTLRPEGTAPVCRAFVEHGMHNLPYPLRLFYIEPMFRHERPQSGRMRQHHQFGVEIFGDNSSEADAEIILVGLTYLKKLGIKNLKLRLNSIGNKNSRERFRKEFLDYFSTMKNDLPEIDKKKFDVNPIRILDSKEKVTRDLILDSPKPVEFLDDESKQHWEKLQSIINQMIEHFDDIDLVIDHNLVRGLDYYSMTVFEIEPIDKSEKSIDAACREFYEETGYKILDKPRKIFTINCEPGRLTTKIHCYYTKKITKLKKSEKGIKTYLVSKDKINKLIFQKKFCNASHIASFLKVIKVPTK